jgi:DNA-binding NarL/FixJ family response regulator
MTAPPASTGPQMATRPDLSVLVVDDDPALRSDFAAMVRAASGLALWGDAGRLGEARALLAAGEPPDVALVDLGLPDGDGTELIRELSATGKTAVLVATIFGDEAHVLRAIEAGARGYLLKDSPRDEFARALHLVHEGGAPLSPPVAAHLLRRFAAPAGRRASVPDAVPARAMGALTADPSRLSTREVDILTRIAQGHTAAEVAAALNLSTHTVNTHVRNTYDKLAVRNRLQAINRARASGQIP